MRLGPSDAVDRVKEVMLATDPCNTTFCAPKRGVSAQECNPVVSDACAWSGNPLTWRSCSVDSVCTGLFNSFEHWITPNPGLCICPANTCAVNGECAKSPELYAPIEKTSEEIFCPVLAAIYNAGGFAGKIDALGRVTRLDLQQALIDSIGADPKVGFFLWLCHSCVS